MVRNKLKQACEEGDVLHSVPRIKSPAAPLALVLTTEVSPYSGTPISTQRLEIGADTIK